MLKRLSSLLVAIAIIITTMTGAFAAPQFNSVPSGEEKIQTLVQTGYIKGYNDGSLKLEDPIKRSEFSRLVVEALEKTQDAASLQGKSKPFTDVELNYWANGIIAVVKSASGLYNNVNVINGYTDGTFRPENFITNAEVLKMLVVLKKADLTQEMVASADWPNSWIFWATELGIIGEGSDVKAFTDVNAFAKRGEVFKMFFNTFEVEKQAEKPSVEKKPEEKPVEEKPEENVVRRPRRPHRPYRPYRPSYPVEPSYPSYPDEPVVPVEKVTVSFDANEGIGSMRAVVLDKGSYYTLPENEFTEPAGQEFDAWDINGVRHYPKERIRVSSDITLKALWIDAPVVPTPDYDDTKFASIEIKTQPKLEYNVGDSLDLSGLKVTLTDRDGNTKDVPFAEFAANGITVDPENGTELTTDINTVTISKGNEKATVAITVNEVTPPAPTEYDDTKFDTIEIKTPATKTTYTEEDKLDLSGLVVTLKDTNGNTKDVPLDEFTANEIKVSPENGTALTTADTTVTIKKGTKSVTFTITVNKVTPPKPATHTVSFEAGLEGATGEMAAVADVLGDYTLPECKFTKDGYVFAGWKVGEAEEVKQANETIQVTADTTLTATWNQTEKRLKENLNAEIQKQLKPVAEKQKNLTLTFDETNKNEATLTLPANLDDLETSGTGAATALLNVINNQGLQSYQIDGQPERKLVGEDGKPVSLGTIAGYIVEDFAQKSKLQDKTTKDVKAILQALVGEKVTATVKVKSVEPGVGGEATDTYSVTFKQVPKKYTVSFEAGIDGTTGEMPAVSDVLGDYTLPACAFTKDGYVFAGWKVGEAEEVKQANDKIQVTADTTLTATWNQTEKRLKDNLNAEIQKQLKPVAEKQANLTLTFDEANKNAATITLPANLDDLETSGTGAATALLNVIKNQGLQSYQIEGQPERKLVGEDGKPVSLGTIAGYIVEDFAQKSKLQDKTTKDVKAILQALVGETVTATVKVKSVEPGVGGEATDTYSVTFKQKKIFTVTVRDLAWWNGVAIATDPVEVEEGKTFTKPDTSSVSRDGYIFKEFRLQGEEKPYDFSTPVTRNITLVAIWKPTKENYEKIVKDELADAIKSNLIDVNKKLAPISAVFDASNRKGYITVPENITADDLKNNGIITMISNIISNNKLVSYTMEGSTKRDLVQSGEAISNGTIANMIVKDLGKASRIQDPTFDNAVAIINKLASDKKVLTATFDISLGSEYDNDIVTDNYELHFLREMNEASKKKSEDAFTTLMDKTTTAVDKQGAFVTSYKNDVYNLAIRHEKLDYKGADMFGIGFKTAMINFLTGGNVGKNGIVQENLKSVTIEVDGKKVAIDKGQLDKIVKGKDLFNQLKPFMTLFLEEGQEVDKLPLSKLVGKSCTFTYTYVDEATGESYTQTRTMKFEEYKEQP